MASRAVAAVFALLTAQSLGAQEGATWIGAALAVEQSANRNPGASPYVYQGVGLAGALRLARQSEVAAWHVEVVGSRAMLRSSISEGDTPREILTGSALGLSYTQRVRAGERITWRAGVAGGVRAEHVRHDYAEPFGGSDDFGFFAMGVGPELTTELRVRRGTIGNRLAVPVASWVDYPYSNTNAHGGRLRLHFASLNRLQVIEEELIYRAGRVGSRGVIWRYGFSFFRYARGDTRILARQWLAVAVDVPLGRGSR